MAPKVVDFINSETSSIPESTFSPQILVGVATVVVMLCGYFWIKRQPLPQMDPEELRRRRAERLAKEPEPSPATKHNESKKEEPSNAKSDQIFVHKKQPQESSLLLNTEKLPGKRSESKTEHERNQKIKLHHDEGHDSNTFEETQRLSSGPDMASLETSLNSIGGENFSNRDTGSDTNKIRKKKKCPPLVQCLCEALSNVVDIHITVQQQEGYKSWGGEGWWKQRRGVLSDHCKATPIKLPLYKFYVDSSSDDPNKLSEVLSKLLSKKLQPNSIREAAHWYTRAADIHRSGYAPFLLSKESGYQTLCVILEHLQSQWARQVADRISDHLVEQKKDEEYDKHGNGIDIDLSLFEDEYNSHVPCTSTKDVNASDWESFVDLLSGSNTTISPAFLKEISQYDESLTETLFKSLSERLRNEKSLDLGCIHKHLTGFSNLATASNLVADFLVTATKHQLERMKMQKFSGREFEELDKWCTLFRIGAFVLEPVDDDPVRPRAAFTKQLIDMDQFPLNSYRNSPEIRQHLQSCQRTMKMAQRTIETFIKSSIKKDKYTMFTWIAEIVKKNDSLVYLTKSELLDHTTNSVVSTCATRSYLLGLGASLANFCLQSLLSQFRKSGASAFQLKYIRHFFNNSKDHYLIPSEGNLQDKIDVLDLSAFSGASHFFFLTSFLLRVGLYPTLKMEQEYHQNKSGEIRLLREYATATQTNKGQTLTDLEPELRERLSVVMATVLGYRSFFAEPEFVTNIANFALLQLQWSLACCQRKKQAASELPDWMIKDPSRWLAQVARNSSLFLKPHRAEEAVELSTKLLQFGSTSFSPIVVTCLLRISTAFVNAGINRARERQQARNARSQRNFGIEYCDGEEEDFHLDIYSSFDHSDLGVTVFTNPVVTKDLCPLLLKTFCTLDAVEGLDMDTEYDFDKLSVKLEISELFYRLWCHPSGDCRKSVVECISDTDALEFASSITSTISVYLDNALDKLSTIYKTMKGAKGRYANMNERAFIDTHARNIASGLYGTRRLFRLLSILSQEERIASLFGGASFVENHTAMNSIRDLANMVIHFIDVLTSNDGGTNPELEMQEVSESTDSLFKRARNMSDHERSEFCRKILKSRKYALQEVGLDVSTFCHQLLSFVSRWHSMAVKVSTSKSKESPLLSFLARHDDIDVPRLLKIAERLIQPPTGVLDGYTVDVAETIFRHDGYVQHRDITGDLKGDEDEEAKRRRKIAKQGKISHENIEQLTSVDEINSFLRHLRSAVDRYLNKSKVETTNDSRIKSAHDAIMQEVGNLDNEDYGEKLAQWVVSSSSFSSPDDEKKFVHFYDRTARSRNFGSGKTLIKEARKCHRIIPPPHINSSCFVCFAEERMDLCRAIVTGPVDTPYAHGIFVFDVFFPADYPNVPPLVTFMTTGGGQVRFNPNLYIDGKVCLSLLGLTFSSDDSQRWNPHQSSLAQILLSIQSQIFGVEEPYFNEGSGIPESMKFTKAGQEGSAKHNSMLRLATLRYAVVAYIRSPPIGFEEVTMRHFSMCRRRLLVQARRWMLEEKFRSSNLYPRYEKIYLELLNLLSSENMKLVEESLLPSDEDLEIVRQLDPDFLSVTGMVVSPKNESRLSSSPAAFNPWASFSQGQNFHLFANSNKKDDSDEELYD